MNFTLKNCAIFSLSFLCYWLWGCAGPQEVANPNGSTTRLDTDSTKNSCSYGSTGPDSDGDGITDACETALNTPANVADCDHDSIPDGQDDPKDCNPDADRTQCDEYCQEDKRRRWRDYADSFALGGAAVTGQAYPGVDILIKKRVIAFANKNGDLDIDGAITSIEAPAQRLTKAICDGTVGGRPKSNFYFYTLGDVKYGAVNVGGVTIPAQTRNDVNFELCGSIDGFDPATVNNLNGEAIGNLQVNYYGGTRGATPTTALVAVSELTKTKITVLPTIQVQIPNPLPQECTGTTVEGTLFDKMTLTLAAIKAQAFENLIVTDESGDPSKGVALGGNFTTTEFKQKTQRRTQGFDCSRLTAQAYGVGGFWVKD